MVKNVGVDPRQPLKGYRTKGRAGGVYGIKEPLDTLMEKD